VAVRWTVRGRVQGVGFRYFTRSMARELGLVGRVRNLPEGHLQVEVAGQPDKVQELKAWVRQGPPGSAVTDLGEEPLVVESAWERFDIDR
jgi:acylphosphatase